MREQDVQYTGVENLDAMEHARNYNRHITGMMARRFRAGARLLDFGAGQGTFARMMRESGYHVVCLEVDARYRTLLAKEGFEVYQSVEAVPDASLDGLYLINVLEHIERDGDVLRSLISKLKPGCAAFIYVPAFQVLYSAMDRAIGHYRRYSKRRLASTLRSAGFHVTAARYHDSIGYLATVVYKMAGNREGRISARQVDVYDRMVFPISKAFDYLVGSVVGKNVSAIGVRRPAGGGF